MIFAMGLSVYTLQRQHSDLPLLVLEWPNSAPQNQSRKEKFLQWVRNTGQSLKDGVESGIEGGSDLVQSVNQGVQSGIERGNNLVQSVIPKKSQPVSEDSGKIHPNSRGT